MHALVAGKQVTFSAITNHFIAKTKVDTSENMHFKIGYLSLFFKHKSEAILK